MKTFNLLFLILFLLTSCEKEPIDKYYIKGTILDEITQQPIANIKVHFDAIGPAIFGGTRRSAGSATSDAQGNFKCKLRVFEDADEVEPEVYTLDNDNYAVFHGLLRIPVDHLKNYKNTPYKIYLLPTATLLIHFKNVNPFSANDYFYIEDVDPLNSDYSANRELLKNCGAPEIGKDGFFKGEFIGENICGTYKYKTAANNITRIKWVVKKNNIMKEESFDIYCPQGKVTEYTINF